MSDETRRIAAFDFDGTITQRDTLAGFLRQVGGTGLFARSMAAHAPSMIRGLRDDELRDSSKMAVLGRILAGRPEREVIEHGERYAQVLPLRFRPEVVERITWHRNEGHELVMLSASLVYYLRPVANALGFDHVIGVEMALDDDARLTGNFTTPNVRAAQKELRLRDWLGDDARRIEMWAYGNSSGDEQLLAMADHPTWIGKRAER